MGWYRSLFPEPSGQRHIGDITPGYFRSPVALLRIQRDLSSATKVIVIFRHPVARAFSHYLHDVRLLDNNRPFMEGGDVVDPSYMVRSLVCRPHALAARALPSREHMPLIFERDIATVSVARLWQSVRVSGHRGGEDRHGCSQGSCLHPRGKAHRARSGHRGGEWNRESQSRGFTGAYGARLGSGLVTSTFTRLTQNNASGICGWNRM